MKRKLVIVLSVILTVILLLTCVTSAVYGWSWPVLTWKLKSCSLAMTYYYGCGEEQTDYCYCPGTSAGVSIGQYYDDIRGYDNLPESAPEMYDVLYDAFNWGCYTDPYYYGYGFLEMTIDPDQNNNTNDGYYNFSYVYDDDVTADDYWVIRDAINNGWPVALWARFTNVGEKSTDGDPDLWPRVEQHWIAIKGYSYWEYSWSWGLVVDTQDHYIVCTDSHSGANNLVLDWDELVNNGLLGHKFVIIKDKIPENFEWGVDGASLDTYGQYGGKVAWTVTKDGNSVAEIDFGQKHSLSRSGRFYYDGNPAGYNYVRGSYAESKPIWRGFWLKTDGNTVFYTRTGDGAHSILVRVLNSASGGKLQYYDGGWKDTINCELDPYTWYFIEFRAIKWRSPYKYSIYVDGVYVQGGVPMHTEQYYSGVTAYYGADYAGSFWIDDIPSSWW